LYVALGAALVVVAAAATGAYLRRAEAGSQRASEQPTGIQQTQTDTVLIPEQDPAAAAPADGNPATPSASSPPGAREFATASAPPARPAAAAGERRPDEGGRAAGADRNAATEEAVSRGAGTSVAPQADASATQPAASDGARLDQIEREIEQLSVRAASVTESLERLRQEQARQGLGLRGDISERQRAMGLNLLRAGDAIDRRDVARAERYAASVAENLDVLEKFLGR
jgi:hypothetical protein